MNTKAIAIVLIVAVLAASIPAQVAAQTKADWFNLGKELWLKQQILGAAQSWQMPTFQLPQWQMPTWQMPQWQVPDLSAAKYLGRKLLAV